jgi:hypothetical protein
MAAEGACSWGPPGTQTTASLISNAYRQALISRISAHPPVSRHVCKNNQSSSKAQQKHPLVQGVCVDRSINSPSNLMWISSSIITCMNAPGISNVATSRPSIVSIMQLSRTASILTVSELVSCFVLYRRCLRPLAHHPQTLMRPQRFFV